MALQNNSYIIDFLYTSEKILNECLNVIGQPIKTSYFKNTLKKFSNFSYRPML